MKNSKLTEHYALLVDDRPPGLQGTWIIEQKTGFKVVLVPNWIRDNAAKALEIAELLETNPPEFKI